MKQFLYPKEPYIGYKILIKKIVKIMEAQIGSILKETDIVRYEDIYGRIN